VALRMNGRSVVIERLVARTPWRPSEGALERMRRVETPPEGGTITRRIDRPRRAHRRDRRQGGQGRGDAIARRFLALSGDARLAAGPDGLQITGAFKADAGWVGALTTRAADALGRHRRDPQVAPAALDGKARSRSAFDLRFNLGDRVWFEAAASTQRALRRAAHRRRDRQHLRAQAPSARCWARTRATARSSRSSAAC
jgi:hypothetical protein